MSFSSFIENIKSKMCISPNNAEENAHGTDVYVNVYDMIAFNKYTAIFKAGVYHTGVEVHDIEYCFGGHPYKESGIFPMAPKDSEHLGENYTLKASIKVGCTDFTQDDVIEIIAGLGEEFRGDQYHLLEKNCNHFTQAFIHTLCGAALPSWINRLANITASMPLIKNNIPAQLLTPQLMLAQDTGIGTDFIRGGSDQPNDRAPTRRQGSFILPKLNIQRRTSLPDICGEGAADLRIRRHMNMNLMNGISKGESSKNPERRDSATSYSERAD